MFQFYCFPLLLCIVQLRRLSFLSLLFFRTLHSVEHTFAFHFSSFLSYFARLQTISLPSCISFTLAWFWSLSPIQCYEAHGAKPKDIIVDQNISGKNTKKNIRWWKTGLTYFLMLAKFHLLPSA